MNMVSTPALWVIAPFLSVHTGSRINTPFKSLYDVSEVKLKVVAFDISPALRILACQWQFTIFPLNFPVRCLPNLGVCHQLEVNGNRSDLKTSRAGLVHIIVSSPYSLVPFLHLGPVRL